MFINSFSENRALDEIMWKGGMESDRPQIAVYQAHALCVLDK
jgi:hypothetical protein